MNLTFLGVGSALRPQDGNTSAYFKEDGKMLLLDCGETVFRTIIEKGILIGVSELYIMISHLHPDHVGSLGSLLSYNHYIRQKNATLVLPITTHPIYTSQVINFLETVGSSPNHYNLISDYDLTNHFTSFKSINYVETKHKEGMLCFSFFFEHNDGISLYTGDTNSPKWIEKVIELEIKGEKKIDSMWIDTCYADYPNNLHLNYQILEKVVPQHLRKHVYCMHIDNPLLPSLLIEKGFNVVKPL